MDIVERTRSKYAALRERDPGCTLFGADQHRYALEPPITQDRASRIAASLGVPLPAGYLRYVTEISAGGGGPGYGLASLVVLSGASFVVDAEGTPVPDRDPDPAKAFPLVAPWRPGDPFPELGEDVHPFDGCLLLADLGCDQVAFLPISGSCAGEVWWDCSLNGGEVARSHGDFLDWYESWLDHALASWVRLRIEIATRDPFVPDRAVLDLVGLVRDDLGRAWVAIYEGRHADANALLAPLLQRSTRDDVDADLALARLLRIEGDFAGSLAALDRARSLGPSAMAIRDALDRDAIMALRGLGRRDEARAIAAASVADRGFHDRKVFLLALVSDDPDAVIAAAAEGGLMYRETAGNVTFGADVLFTAKVPPEERLAILRGRWDEVRARYGSE